MINTAFLDELEDETTPAPQDYFTPPPAVKKRTGGINLDFLDSLEAGEHPQVTENKAKMVTEPVRPEAAAGPLGFGGRAIADPSAPPSGFVPTTKPKRRISDSFTTEGLPKTTGPDLTDTQVKDTETTLGKSFADIKGNVVNPKTSQPFTQPEYEQLKWNVNLAPEKFSAREKSKLRTIENSVYPMRDVGRRITWLRDYVLSFGGAAGRYVGAPNLRQELLQQAKEFPGWSGALAEPSGDAGTFYIKYMLLLPAIMRGLTGVSEAAKRLPQVKKATDAVEKLGGMKWLLEKHPRKMQAVGSAIETFAKGATAIAPVSGLEYYGRGMSLEEAKPYIIRDAIAYGAVVTAFDLASSYDRYAYGKQLRAELKAITNRTHARRFEALQNEMRTIQRGKPSGAPRTLRETQIGKEIKGLASLKRTAYQTIDDIVSSVEAELAGMSKGEPYKQSELVRESALKMAQQFAEAGGRAGVVQPAGAERFRTEMGRTEPSIKMPTTRFGEMLETIKGEAKITKPTKPVSATEVGLKAKAPTAKIPAPPTEKPVVAPTQSVTPAKPAVEGKIYKGKAYRVETGFKAEGTAADVARYEQEELGNKLGITPEKLTELENYPASDVVWVARTKEGASRYGKPEAVDVEGGRIIAEIPDGVLVLKAPPAPAAKEPWEMTKAEFDKYGEKIKATAVVVRGKTFTGKIHADAIKKAKAAGEVITKGGDYYDKEGNRLSFTGWADYFVTTKGRVIDRLEADQMMGIAAVETPGFEKGASHKNIVKFAFNLGKPVPRAVLEEYKSEKWAQEALKGTEYDSEKEKGLVRGEPQGQEPGRPVQVEEGGEGEAGPSGILQTQGLKIGDTFEGAGQKWKITGLGRTTGGDIGIAAETSKGKRVIWSPEALKQKLAKPAARAKRGGRPLKELGGIPEKPPGLTKAEVEHLGRPQQRALRAGQAAGEKIGYKLAQREAEDKLNSFKFRLKLKDVNFKQIRDEMFDLVKKTLPTYERGKTKVMSLLKSVSPEKTDKANRKNLIRAIVMTSKYAEEATQRGLRSQIYKELKKTKPKKKQGLLRGKFTADVQRKLDEIRTHIKYDREQARLQIANNITKYEEGTLSYEDMRSANEQLSRSGIKGMTSTELQNVLDNIISLKETGKSIRQAKKETEDARIKQAVSRAVEVLTGGRGIKKGTVSVPRGELEARKTAIEKIANWQYGWDNYLDKLSKFDTGSQMYQSDLSKFGASIHDAHNKEIAGIDEQINKTFGKFQEIFDVKTTSQVNAALNNLKQEVDLGIFRNADGVEIHLKLTKEQLIKKYQELQDPTLEATFRGGITEEGKIWGMRWTDEIIDAVNDSLSPQEKAWADYHMQWYQEYYPSVNEVYREIYGVDLPHNLYYSPIGRDIEADIPENVLLAKESAHYASTVNGSLKSRTASKLPLRFTNADAVLVNHITRMEHFKAWSNAMRDMRRLFGNKQIRTAIRQYHGKDILRQVDTLLNQMARGGIEKAKINRGVDFLRRNFTLAILGVKPVIGLKQIPSVIAYTTEMPLVDFVGGVSDFWSNPLGHYRFMRGNSSYFKTRWKAGFERDIKFAMKKGYAKRLAGKGNVRDWFMALIRAGDKFATMQGGWAKYKSALKEGTQSEALAAAEQSTKRTQPSFSLESLSPLQRGGSWMKLFTMFQNQPNKYFRIIADNARNMRFGRQKISKGTINILLAWVILPALFQFIADAFQFKKKHQLRAAVLGPINHLLVIGQLAQSVWGWMTKEPFDYQASPVFSTGRDLQIAVTKTAKLVRDGKNPYKEITIDDLVKTVEYYGQAAGKVTGIPTPWAIQAERAARKTVVQKPETGKGRIGWRKHPAAEFIFSPWALEAEDYLKAMTNKELRVAIGKNTYRKRYKRKDGKWYPKGHAHSGKEEAVARLRKELELRESKK